MIPLSDLKLTEDGKSSITIHTKAYTRLVKQYFRVISWWYLLTLYLAQMKVKVKGAVSAPVLSKF